MTMGENNPRTQKKFDYTKDNLKKALVSVGVQKGDIVFCHLGISKLGTPKEIYEGKSKFEVIYEAITETIGPQGTLLTPTFSYSFCKGEIFDPLETPSDVGYFGEALRKMKGAKRSLDPIFSVAGIGPKVDELLDDLPNDCYGKDCVYDRLVQRNAKLCNIGVNLFYTSLNHYTEQMAGGVPHRFLKLFSGYVKKDGKLVKENWIYVVRILGEFSKPAFDKLEPDAAQLNLSRTANVGTGRIICVSFQDLYDLYRTKLSDDPWYLAKGPACEPIEAEKQRVGVEEYDVDIPVNASMEQMIRSVWHLPRDLVSDGYDAALKALSSQVPMTIHKYPTGTKCFTWIIPEKWTCHEAYLETVHGKNLFSYEDNPLHVVSYSLPYEGEISREELFKHLHVHPTIAEAIPFVFKYYEREWGLCCSRNLKDSLADERYRVVIKTDFSYSTLKVGEVIVPGLSQESIILCAHLCHPHMVADGLSGVVAGIDVMRKLMKQGKHRYTYRLIILPETIGSAAYLSRNEELIPRMVGGFFLEMFTTSHPHSLQRSLPGDTQIDKCAELILKEFDPNARIGDFLSGVLNDERMFNAPGIGVPMLSLYRALPPDDSDEPYREYHSSLDTPDNANFQNLEDSRDLVLRIINAIEGNRIPHPKFKGEIFCSRFNGIDYATMGQDVLRIIYHIDGCHTVADIAQQSGVSFTGTREILDVLSKEKLIEEV